MTNIMGVYQLLATGNFRVFWGIIAILALAPLPLASNRPWAWSVLALLVGLVCLLWAVELVRKSAHAPLPLSSLKLVSILFGMGTLWALLQIVPLPGLLPWHPLWDEAALALFRPLPATISVSPEESVTALMRLLTYAAFFFISAQVFRSSTRARLGIMAASIIILCYSLYGLVEFFSGTETILWFHKWAYIGDLTSTFVNRNSFGAFAGIGMVLSTGQFIHAQRRRRSVDVGIWLRTEWLLSRAAPWLLVAMIQGTALMLTHSRGAFIASAIALLSLCLSMTYAGVIRARSGLISAILMAVVGVTVVGISGDVTADRLASAGGSDDEGRVIVYAATLKAIGAAPWTGYGLGTFQEAFPMVRPPTLNKIEIWQYAHNVFLETVMDLGIPGALCLIGAVLSAVTLCIKGLSRRRRDHVYPASAIAVALLLGIHGFMDFSIQMPAIALMFSFILGLGCAQSFNSERSRIQ